MGDILIESKMLAAGIETGAELAIPCQEVKFQVEMLKHDLFDKDKFDSADYFRSTDFHTVEFNLLGTHISYHQLNKDEGAQDSERILVASLLPASAEKIVMYCYAQKENQDCVVPVTVFDRNKNIWIKDICTDKFEADNVENKLSTLIFRITGPDGTTTDLLTRTVLAESDEYDDVDENGNPTGEKLRSIRSLVGIGKIDIIPPLELAE